MNTREELFLFLREQGLYDINDIDDLYEGNWYKDLPENIQCRRDVIFLIAQSVLYSFWDSESTNALFYNFEKHYSNDKDFIREYLSNHDEETEFFVRASVDIQSDFELLLQYLKIETHYMKMWGRFLHLDEQVKGNRKLMLKLICELPELFSEFNDEFKNDAEFQSLFEQFSKRKQDKNG